MRREIVRLLREADDGMTRAQLQAALGISERMVKWYLTAMRRERPRCIYIDRFVPSTGPWVPVYDAGNLGDCPLPHPRDRRTIKRRLLDA